MQLWCPSSKATPLLPAAWQLETGFDCPEVADHETQLRQAVDHEPLAGEVHIEAPLHPLGGLVVVARRLAENIGSNHKQEIDDPDEREGMVSGIAEVFFEIIHQLRGLYLLFCIGWGEKILKLEIIR